MLSSAAAKAWLLQWGQGQDSYTFSQPVQWSGLNVDKGCPCLGNIQAFAAAQNIKPSSFASSKCIGRKYLTP